MSESALFVYGSLLVPEIRSRLIRPDVECCAATLREHERRVVQGSVYPAIRPKPGARVDGLLLLHLSEAELGELDAYEGAEYRRTRVEVEMVGQEGPAVRAAYTYVIAPHLEESLSSEDWSFAAFVERLGPVASWDGSE